MKYLLFIISILPAYQQAAGQNIIPDSIGDSHKVQLYLFNKQFDNLPSKPPLNELEGKLGMVINNLAGCFLVLQIGNDRYVGLDSLGKNAVIERIVEISDRFIENGTPLIILGTGMNSVERTAQLNSEPKKFNLLYITQGNSCLGNSSMGNLGVSAFNQRTLSRLGLEALPRKAMPASTTK